MTAVSPSPVGNAVVNMVMLSQLCGGGNSMPAQQPLPAGLLVEETVFVAASGTACHLLPTVLTERNSTPSAMPVAQSYMQQPELPAAPVLPSPVQPLLSSDIKVDTEVPLPIMQQPLQQFQSHLCILTQKHNQLQLLSLSL